MDLNTIARYRDLLENQISVQERKVLVSVVREVGNEKFTATQAKAASRIRQTNQMHVILGRLVKKEILTKLGRAEYSVKDPELVYHIEHRRPIHVPGERN